MEIELEPKDMKFDKGKKNNITYWILSIVLICTIGLLIGQYINPVNCDNIERENEFYINGSIDGINFLKGQIVLTAIKCENTYPIAFLNASGEEEVIHLVSMKCLNKIGE